MTPTDSAVSLSKLKSRIWNTTIVLAGSCRWIFAEPPRGLKSFASSYWSTHIINASDLYWGKNKSYSSKHMEKPKKSIFSPTDNDYVNILHPQTLTLLLSASGFIEQAGVRVIVNNEASFLCP